MLLIELIKKVSFDEVWEILKGKYDVPEKGKSAYIQVFDELRDMDLQIESGAEKEEATTIGVCEFEDLLEPGKFVYDVFGISQGDSNRYSLSLEPWSNWINYNILDKSIQIYGEATVLAHILYEMTFYGYSSEDVEERHQEVINALNDSYKMIEEGKSEFIPAEDVFSKLGFEKDEAIDLEIERKKSEEMKAAINRNEAIFQELISDWLKEGDQ